MIVLIPLIALIPAGRLALDWYQFSTFTSSSSTEKARRGYDWIRWENTDNGIEATYVLPNSPADVAGVQAGDALYELGFQQYYDAEDVQKAIQGVPSGLEMYYTLEREGALISVYVPIQPYPTFIYPLTETLWAASRWGFALIAFLHLIALGITAPLTFRNSRAFRTSLLISASSIWVLGNFARLMMIYAAGVPDGLDTFYNSAFDFLTLMSFVGWIAFPALLLYKVIRDQAIYSRLKLLWHGITFIPLVLFLFAAFWITSQGTLGPITFDGLVGPILFYVSWYVATASLLTLLARKSNPRYAPGLAWSRIGSYIVLLLASISCVSILGIIPKFGLITEVVSSWMVVMTQWLSMAPVMLVSIATIQHGKIDQVLSGVLSGISKLGLLFFGFIGGMALLSPYLERVQFSQTVVSGFYMVILLILFERGRKRIAPYLSGFFTTERNRIRKELSKYGDRMRLFVDQDALVQETVNTVGEIFHVYSAVLFLKPPNKKSSWLQASFKPEPPYLTEDILGKIWPHLQKDGKVWAANSDLSETSIPAWVDMTLRNHHAALAIPVTADQSIPGILVLSQRRRRGAVFNLEDIELLKSLCRQLALSEERLVLLEREKALARQSMEAQLTALRAQINPHFLFNALNAISSLIAEKPDDAEETVEHLAAIFRYVLKVGGKSFVPVSDEWRLVSHYLAIEKVRFDENLIIEADIPPAVHNFPIPAFALQTLVENAIKHGIGRKRGGGKLTLSGRILENGLAEIAVSDTGIGIPALFSQPDNIAPDPTFYGVGLSNVNDRLQHLYNRTDLLEIWSAPNQGTRSRLLLPPPRSLVTISTE